MDIAIYFKAVDTEMLPDEGDFPGKRYSDIVDIYNQQGNFPDLSDTDIAIFGVSEDRNSVNNEGCAFGADVVRKHLYRLFTGNEEVKIADLGNIIQGYSVDDTYFAVTNVVAGLVMNGIIPVIIGGGQDLSYAVYRAYEQLGQIINIVAVDPMFDLGKDSGEIDSRSYLSKIILHQPNYLFNYTNVGYQSYFVDNDAVDLMNKLYFDIYRLGNVRENMDDVEPVVRNADMLSIDISSVRSADAPGNGNAIPNGFNGEDLCRIVRYAGLSDKLSSIGFYEYNPAYDPREQTAMLLSQALWYFLEGYYQRKDDYPARARDQYVKFHVKIQDHKEEIIFYKSKKSERWWMEVPVETDLMTKYERHYMVPCSHRDYENAMDNNIPDRWWQVFQKMM
ncbi:MAG: formimidoylglutamase [Bacteroidales bacterium]|nr:formimidoylglutamase [Bacteroidales bacterium]